MKVTCIYGSPRTNGNSAGIANRFLNVVEKRGAEIQRFTLNKLNFKGCQGCDVCKTKQTECVVDDDLKIVLNTVKETDILVIATPVYYSDVPSQLKAFIDRTYSYVDADYLTNPNASRLKKGKELIFIQTQEAGSDMYHDIFNKYSLFFQFYGFEECTFIQAGNIGQSGNIEKQPEVLEKVVAEAKRLCMD